MRNFFKLIEKGTNVKTEVLAGLTTFMTMAYILAVNPAILSATGMDAGAIFTATALSSIIATLIMVFLAKLPFALAPGLGFNSFFAFTVVLGMGHSWQTALTAVFIEGIIFLILTIFNIRKAIIDSVPLNIKKATSVGIGLFIAFIGLKNAGIIVKNDATFVTFGNIANPSVIVAFTGIIIIAVLLASKKRGALLIGILATTIVGIPMGITKINFDSSFLPHSIAPIAFQFDFSNIFLLDILIVILSFLFIDMFDTVGTLIGISNRSKILNADGSIPNCKQALFADSIGTIAGACLGTSTVTTYVKSTSGCAEGGRTGLTALVVAILFAVSLFLSPIFLAIPTAATSPALLLVGVFMISPIKEIDFRDYTEAIPVK